MSYSDVNYGRELSCTDTLKTGRYVSGVTVVAEAIYRRLTTPRGMLLGGESEQNYGLDLMSLVGTVDTTGSASSLAGRIENECRKDERLESVKAVVVRTVDGPSTTYTITIQATTALGPFTLQMLVSAVTVELLGVTS
jgi:hypothetical protein